jgi:hypothetical protein
MSDNRWDREAGGCATAVGALFIVALMGFCVGVKVQLPGRDADWRREAVRHGAAEYDPATGDWRWKSVAEETE